MGHARIDTTQTYTTIRPAALKTAVVFYEERVLRVLGGPEGEEKEKGVETKEFPRLFLVVALSGFEPEFQP